jgi:hypothetical protein
MGVESYAFGLEIFPLALDGRYSPLADLSL